MLTQANFESLASAGGDHLISIYVPTSTVGTEQKDRIRLKNALQQAKAQLEERGMTETDAGVYLQPAYDFQQNFNFSEDARNGLALFVGDGEFHSFTLEQPVEASVITGSDYDLGPVVRELTRADEDFFLLTLSRSETKLFVARGGRLEAIDTTGIIPEDMEAGLLLDDPNRQLQRVGTNNQNGTVFGHGAGNDEENDHLKAWLDVVDRGVNTLLRNETRPLLLAGVEELIPIYQAANQYNHLIEDRYVAGNVNEKPTTELYAAAQEVIGDYFHQQRDRDFELFDLNLAKNEAGANLLTIVPAAINGRVAVLWVAKGAEQFGRYEPATNGVEFTDADAPGARELHNLALTEAKKSGARVYVVEQTALPRPTGTICAIYRYGVPAEITNLN